MMHDRTKEYLDYVTSRLTTTRNPRVISIEQIRTIVIHRSTPEVLLVYANILLQRNVAGKATTGPSILQRLGIKGGERVYHAYVMYDLNKDTFCSPKPNNLQFNPTSIKELGSYLQCNIEILDYSDWKRLKNTGTYFPPYDGVHPKAARIAEAYGMNLQNACLLDSALYMLKHNTTKSKFINKETEMTHDKKAGKLVSPYEGGIAHTAASVFSVVTGQGNSDSKFFIKYDEMNKKAGKLVFTYEGGVTYTAAGVFNVVTGQNKSDNKFFIRYDYETQDHEGNMSKGTITRVVTHHLRKVELVGKENSMVVLDLGYVAPVKQKKHSRTKEEWEALEKQKEEERIKEHRIHQLKKELAKLQK